LIAYQFPLPKDRAPGRAEYQRREPSAKGDACLNREDLFGGSLDENPVREWWHTKGLTASRSTYDLIRKMCRWCNRIHREERLGKAIKRKLLGRQKMQGRT
jgi:hypothetical protein